MKDIIYKILWATIEDFVGLWEISWELNSIFPEKIQTDNQEIAKKILQYFLDQKLVIRYLSRWGTDELKQLHANDAVKILEVEKYWEAPALNEKCIKISSTKKGEKFYYEELIDDFMK